MTSPLLPNVARFPRKDTDTEIDDTLPSNLAAEQAVLGALLYNPDCYSTRIEGFVQADDFFGSWHREILSIAKTMMSLGQQVTPLSITEQLNRKYEGADWIPGFIGDIVEAAAFGIEITDYSKMVADLAKRRKLVLMGREIAQQAAGSAATSDLMEKAQQAITDIDRQSAARREWLDARSTIAETFTSKAMADDGIIACRTGIEKLDNFLGGLKPGNLIILAARPSMGKSAVADNIARNAAAELLSSDLGGGIPSQHHQNRHKVVAFISAEMSPQELSLRAATAEIMKTHKISLAYQDLEDRRPTEREGELIISALSNMGPVQWLDAEGISLAKAESDLRRLYQKYGRIDLIVTDYLQAMQIREDRNLTRAAAIGEITQGFKRLARRYDCPSVMLSQLSRDVERRENKRPVLQDLRDSGSIEQDADVVIFVYRDHYYLEQLPEPTKPEERMAHEAALNDSERVMELIVAKRRMGKKGTVKVYWDPQSSYIGSTLDDVRQAPAQDDIGGLL